MILFRYSFATAIRRWGLQCSFTGQIPRCAGVNARGAPERERRGGPRKPGVRYKDTLGQTQHYNRALERTTIGFRWEANRQQCPLQDFPAWE